MNMLDGVDWEVVNYNDLEMILQLNDFSESYVDTELSSGLTPLCSACKYNREDLVTILLHHQAQVNKQSTYLSRSPLHFACNHTYGNIGISRKIIEAQAHLDELDGNGNSSLHLACQKVNIPVVELLLKHGASVNIAGENGETPLTKACYTKDKTLVEVLLKAGSDVNSPEGLPLEIALRDSALEILYLLIQAGANVHKRPYLTHASEYGNTELMKVLYQYGADINKTDSLGMNPLQIACYSQTAGSETVELLLHWGADIHACSHMKETALHYACSLQDVKKVRLLLAYGADVNAQDRLRLSPLMVNMHNLSMSIGPQYDIAVVIARLLLAAGSRLKLEYLDSLRYPSSLLPCVAQKKRDLFNMLYQHVSQPLGLLALCRVRLRRLIQPNIDKNIDSLPLPQHVKRYLNFWDIVN
ncbi:ankyrin repeat protein [Biomphalaria pfeifferi]|uniref:Ankyrin repeat protein n=1 Tax=Biomphalaria pfeifferi TaxID=112525 RepID=A0AAD8AUP0_BIOPF|nr:ankyrin repeat protein [Biomphalaria pfeifferi]